MGYRCRDTMKTVQVKSTHVGETLESGNWVPGTPVHRTNSVTTGKTAVIEWDSSIRKGEVKKTRACTHTVTERQSLGAHSWTVNANSTYRTQYGPFTFNSDPTVPLESLVLNLSTCHSDALEFFKAGCTDQELDLAANLAELKSITGTFSFLKRKFNRLSAYFKTGANAHLAYSFGIKPLVQDAQRLFEALTSLEKKVQWFRRNQGKVIPVRFTADITDLVPDYNVTFQSDAGHVRYRRVTSVKATYTAFALVSYDVSRLSNLELQLRTFVRASGLDNLLGTAWELTPWSFIVDWFLSIGDFLSTLTPKVTVPIRFIDQGWSVKLACNAEHTIRHGSAGGKGLPFTYERFQKRHYVRRCGIPVSFGTIVASGDLSLRQLALSVSLAIQKA